MSPRIVTDTPISPDTITETTISCPLCETLGRKVEFKFLRKNNSWYGSCPECLFRAYAPFHSMRTVLEKVVKDAFEGKHPGK